MSEQPDVIIVGSGPAGVSAAWPLAFAGLKVLMIDASGDASLTVERALPERRWIDEAQLEDGADAWNREDLSPKFSLPGVRAAVSEFVSRNRIELQGFFAAGALSSGGLSKIWGALVEPFQPRELIDFPFAASALEPSYKATMRRIGVSGESRSGESSLTSAPARALLERHLSRPTPDFQLRPANNAILQEPQGSRQACNQCGGCLFGCPKGSIYDSSLELPALLNHQNFSYESGSFVQSLHCDGLDHVLVVSSANAVRLLRARTIVLAAGTIASTSLVLRRLGWDGPVRLLSNPSGVSAFFAPSFVGSDLPVQSISLGQLFYRIGSGRDAAAGVIYGADALPLHLLAERLPLSRPAALRAARALAPAILLATAYLPGSYSRNRLQVLDREGAERISIEGELSVEASSALKGAQKELRRRLLRLGALALPGSAKLLQPGADAHYAGTLPMGGAGAISTTEFGELQQIPRLFVVDGSSLTSLPATHPTLTIMANADRIGHEIARRHGRLVNSKRTAA